jgi:4-aminobutyrate aminotransferase
VAAALATLRLLEGGLVDNAARVGERLRGRLRSQLSRHEAVGEVRGLGLMIGVEIVKDRASRSAAPERREKILEEAFRRGLLLLGCGKSTIRLAPPLVVDEEDADTAVRILDEAIAAAG